jgi:hypothetical protein
MAGSEKRKRERRRRERHAKGRGAREETVTVVTHGPVEQILAGTEMSLRVDRDHPDYVAFRAGMEAAVEATPDTVLGVREEIARLCEPYHAFDVLFALWAVHGLVFADTMRPLVDGSTRVPEYVAHVLLDRPGPGPTREPTDEERQSGPDPAGLSGLVDRIFALLPLWFTHRQMEGPLAEDPYLDLRSRLYMHRLLISSFTYEWQERETLHELLDPFQDQLRDSIGFGAADALALVAALAELPRERAAVRAAEGRRWRESSIALADARRRGEGEPGDPYIERMAQQPKAEADEWALAVSFGWTTLAVGRDASFTAAELAAAAGVEIAAAEGFLAAFSVDFGAASDRTFWEKDPRRAIGGEMEAMRSHPILHDGEGHYLPAAIDTVFYGIRDLLTGALKADPRVWNRFDRHRAHLLERRAVDALAKGLKADWSHTGVKYRYVDADGEEAEGEADGILRSGTIVVLVEAKAGSLAPSARRTAPASLQDGLQDLIGKASEQLSRSQLALLEGAASEVTDSSGSPLDLDLDKVSRTLRVAVSLEELSPLAPAVWQLKEAGLLPAEEELPWALGIHELELICELAESPAQLVHYVTRRRRAMRQRVWGMDEMDFFMKYLGDGLYYEDEEIGVAQVEVHSHTERLDEYLYGEHGARPRTKRPRQKMAAKTRDLLAQLAAVDSPARIEAQLMVLDLGDEARRQLCSRMRQVTGRTERDGLPHDVSLVLEGDFGVTIHCVTEAGIPTLGQSLKGHGVGRSEKSGLRRWLGLGTVAGARGEVAAMALLIDSRRAEVY